MSSTGPTGSAPDRRIALLIDADNVSHSKIAAMLAELAKYGTASIRRAYGNWASPGLKGWTEKLHAHAIRPIQQFSYSSGKNATDIALVIDAMELLYTQKPDAFCLASSDADFTPLVMQLRANGHDVYGFGERKTPDPFVNACTTFLYLDSLDDPAGSSREEPAKPRSTRSRASDKAKPADAADTPAKGAPDSAPKSAAKPARPLALDPKLVTILRGAVDAAARDDGWAVLSTAGSAAKRQAPIDPRNYGVKNFPALFEATGLFEIVQGPGGHRYVADRRNTDRAKAPEG